MGNKNLKAVLLIVSAVVIILFTSIASKMEASAKESDFIIKEGVLKQYLGFDKEIIIPKSVITIGAGVFRESKIEKVTIPDSVKVIEGRAFQNCSKLTEIVIPGSVSELGESAFQGCSSLFRAELSSGLSYVGMSAFEDCTSLKEVIIPDGVDALVHYAFRNCTSLEMIDLPESINFIGDACFENCTSLETILFPTQETFFGDKAIFNTLWLDNYEGDNVIINHTLILYRGNETNITIPDNITVIGSCAFVNCSFITNVNIPMGVKVIGHSAFYDCSGLTEIVLPDSVTKIGYWSFSGCSNLAKITIPKNVEIIWNSLEKTKWMADYQGDFIILNGNLLRYRGTASKVVIPNNVTSVCSEAFSNNDIVTEVTVPTSVTKMYYQGFYNCRNLQKIFIMGKNIKLEYETFFACSNDLKLYGLLGGAVQEYAKRSNIQFVNYGLNKEKVTLFLGGDNTSSLRVNGIDGKVQWESEDATIAEVSKSGKATAVKTGSTKIKAIVNGITMTCKITVKKPYISKSSVSILIGRTSRLNIIGISTGITWSSNNKSVASVSSTGIVTANQAGTATITATINGKEYTCKFIVK